MIYIKPIQLNPMKLPQSASAYLGLGTSVLRRTIGGAVCITLASSMADAAVISHTYSIPIGINTLGKRKLGGFIKGGVTYRIDYVGAPYPLDFDGNGSVDLTISGTGRSDVTRSMFVTQHGRNQVWSYAGGFEGLDFGSHALALVGGSRFGPSLMSPVKAVGWHNDDDTRGFSILMEALLGSEVSGAFWPDTFLQQKYLGFRFEREGALHYGWMALSAFGSLGEEIFVNSWAYESEPDTALVVGQIPEPTVMAFLGFGLCCGMRRRREV